jgi:DNA mismatch endonuclease (patch repair protein)
LVNPLIEVGGVADVLDAEKRSEVMSLIRARGNKETEMLLASILRKNMISGWRRHLPLMGRPDFTFRKNRLVVFVDGCFWHCCPSHSNIPANNHAFWKKKLTGNVERDKLVSRTLKRAGWKVIRIWEHDLRNEKKTAQRILKALEKNSKKRLSSPVPRSTFSSPRWAHFE